MLRCKYAALNSKHEYDKAVDAVEHMQNYKADVPLFFGDLKITPYYCSHSAFDAYMFKIEWNGKVILHTGDFRKHGYMGKSLIPVLKKYIGQVDVLITEGTMLSRNTETVKTEKQIQNEVTALLRKPENKYVFALCSSTDIDRLASFHAACKATHRHFYVDKYQYSVLETFTQHTTSPLYDFVNKDGKMGTTFQLLDLKHYNKPNVIKEMKNRGFLMPIRSSGEYLVKKLMTVYNDTEPILLYSMWNGYWKGTADQRIPGVETIRALFKPENIIPMHTSGHADTSTLAEVCETVNPRLAIIPIHKDENTDFKSLKICNELKNRVTVSDTVIQDINVTIK